MIFMIFIHNFYSFIHNFSRYTDSNYIKFLHRRAQFYSSVFISFERKYKTWRNAVFFHIQCRERYVFNVSLIVLWMWNVFYSRRKVLDNRIQSSTKNLQKSLWIQSNLFEYNYAIEIPSTFLSLYILFSFPFQINFLWAEKWAVTVAKEDLIQTLFQKCQKWRKWIIYQRFPPI